MGVRQSWVYPSDGSEPYLKGSRPTPEVTGGIAFIGDHEEFQSPIDGKIYSGRAGMREHNAIHGVVNNRDLVGLPVWQANSDVRSESQRRADAAHRKQLVINAVNKHYR